MGAVCIEGPKWSGKTRTSSYHSNSKFLVGNPDNNFQNRALAEMSPALVLEGETPRLIDEWQEVPPLWDAVLYAVDQRGQKGQASGLYAQEYAKLGFVALAFDQSFTGESGGKVRDVASPEIFTEDFSAAVDYLGTQSFVDRERIGVTGICGLSGMALTAAGTDPRIKAVATVSMYDMSRSITRGYRDSYTKEQREQIKAFLAQQRFRDYEAGTYKKGPHEIAFDEQGSMLTEQGSMLTEQGGLPTLPEEIVPQLGPVVEAFYKYYVKRAWHPRSINSTGSWTQTTPVSFFSFDLMKNIAEISPRPILLVAGENAHSRYYAEDAYAAAQEPKELLIVPEADHVDLYDRKDKIPFDKLAAFFADALK